MARRKNNIIMINRRTPKRVKLPNGRAFYAIFMRISRNALPLNPVQGGKRRQPPRVRAKPAHVERKRGFNKIFNFVKKVAKRALVKNLERLHLKKFQIFMVMLLIKFLIKN